MLHSLSNHKFHAVVLVGLLTIQESKCGWILGPGVHLEINKKAHMIDETLLTSSMIKKIIVYVWQIHLAKSGLPKLISGYLKGLV